MGHIFISYSRLDQALMEQVARTLQSEDLAVWVDQRRLRTGRLWGKDLENAIRTCDAFVVLLSPNANASDFVRKEIDFAGDHERDIYPVLVAGERKTSMPISIYDAQCLDATGDNFPDAMSTLTHDITERLAALGRPRTPQETARSMTLPSPTEWTSVRLCDIATISSVPGIRPEKSSEGEYPGEYPIYTMSVSRVSGTSQYTHEGKSILLSVVPGASERGRKVLLRIVGGRFAVRGNVLVIQPQHPHMTEYLARYMDANFDWANLIVGAVMLPYLSRRSLEVCQVVIPSDPSELKTLCERISALDVELKHSRRRMEYQLQLLDELEATAFQSLIPHAGDHHRDDA